LEFIRHKFKLIRASSESGPRHPSADNKKPGNKLAQMTLGFVAP
jgi:hypothetical protein